MTFHELISIIPFVMLISFVVYEIVAGIMYLFFRSIK
jgi:hypothetical protein